MKLYATLSSDRASKSQGGNKFIDIDLRVGSKSNSVQIGKLRLQIEKDENNKDVDKYGHTFYSLWMVNTGTLLTQIRIDENEEVKIWNEVPKGESKIRRVEIKGEKKKGEKCMACGSINGICNGLCECTCHYI